MLHNIGEDAAPMSDRSTKDSTGFRARRDGRIKETPTFYELNPRPGRNVDRTRYSLNLAGISARFPAQPTPLLLDDIHLAHFVPLGGKK